MSIFDRSLPIEARGAVPVRELARSFSSLIDRVERGGEVIALSRYGRVVAVLAPTPEKLMVTFEKGRAATSQPEPDVVEQDFELPERLQNSEAARALLLHALSVHPMPYSIDGHPFPIHDLILAKSRLELAGLADRTLQRGSFLTPLGIATARTLRRRLDRKNRPPA